MKRLVFVDTPDGVEEMDEEDLPLELQVAVAFAEASVEHGRMLEVDDFAEVEMAENKKAKDTARKRNWRELKRIQNMRRVLRTCPVCERKFWVVLGDKTGNLAIKAYDTDRCRETAKKQRARARN